MFWNSVTILLELFSFCTIWKQIAESKYSHHHIFIPTKGSRTANPTKDGLLCELYPKERFNALYVTYTFDDNAFYVSTHTRRSF